MILRRVLLPSAVYKATGMYTQILKFLDYVTSAGIDFVDKAQFTTQCLLSSLHTDRYRRTVSDTTTSTPFVTMFPVGQDVNPVRVLSPRFISPVFFLLQFPRYCFIVCPQKFCTHFCHHIDATY